MNVKHFHNQYEIFYIIEGERQFFFDNKAIMLMLEILQYLIPIWFILHAQYQMRIKATTVLFFTLIMKDVWFWQKYPGLNLVNYFHNNYGIYHLNEDQRIAFLNLYRDLRHELTKKNSGYQSRVEIATIYWLYKLLSLKHDSTQIHAVINSPKELSASNISAYLEANYTKELALDTISDELFMSKYYMCRIFKEYTGFTITEYVNTLRIKKATQILESSNLSISDVAAELGFESASYFERIFKK